MLKLWLFFAKKRILGTKHCYRYYWHLAVLIAVLITVFLPVAINKSASLMQESVHGWPPVDTAVFAAAFLMAAMVLWGVSYALQYTVYILDLPAYLNRRKMDIFVKQNQCTYDAKYESRNMPKQGNGVFANGVSAFDEPANVSLCNYGAKNDGGNPAVVVGGDGQGIVDNIYQVGTGSKVEKNSVFWKKNTHTVKKAEKYGIRYCPCNSYYKSYTEMPWWCRSCAFASGWKPFKNDVYAVNLPSCDGTAASEKDFAHIEAKSPISGCVPKFVNDVGYIKANKSNKEKCSYLKHIVKQAPFEKIPFMIKATIVLTLPVWLLQMLATPFPIKIISHEKYYSCCKEESFLSGAVGFPPADNTFVLDGNLEWDSLLDVLTGAAAVCGLQMALQLSLQSVI